MSRALAACPPRPAAQAPAAPHAAATHAPRAESALREVAFVLALTKRVRESMRGGKAAAA